MAVLEQDVVATNFDNTTSWSVAARSGAPSGTPIIVTICLNHQQLHANMVTVPAGFTLIHEEGGGSANVAYILKYLKASSGSESGTYDFEGSVSTWGTIAAKWLDGADDADPVDVFAGANSNLTSEATAVAPTVTTTEDGCLIDRTFMDRNGVSTMGLSGLDRTLWNASQRSAAGVQDQASAGATGTNSATLSASNRWAAVTVAYKPATEPTARLLPELLTQLPLALEDLAVQTPSAQGDQILISVPEGEGTVPDERTVLVILCRDYLPESAIVGVPTGALGPIEANNPEVTGASLLVYWMPTGYVHADPQYVFTVDATASAGLSSPRIVAYPLRDRWVHPTVPLAATPVFLAQGGSEPVGAPDGLVRFPAVTPDATALKSYRLCLGSARRTGVWTLDANLDLVFPRSDENAYYIAGYEPWDSTLEAPLRTASHDGPLNPPDSYYGRVGLSILWQGAPDYGLPGAPDHTGTEAVSWESMKLVAARDTDHPNATTSIEVYRHTASMAGEPVANGTLIHTFSPDGQTVHGTGWVKETEYYLQLRAVNANGATLGPEFTRTTWRQAVHTLTDAQTLVVPMDIEEVGVTIEKEEYHGSNADAVSWLYNHPAAATMLLVFVSALDNDEAAVVSSVTYDGVAMTKIRADQSSPSSAGGRMIVGAFVMMAAPSGSAALTVQITGGAGNQDNYRWHVYSLSGLNLALRGNEQWNGSTVFDTSGRQMNVVAELGDLCIDYLAWRNGAINVASIDPKQTQRLADDSPTRQNGTSVLATSAVLNPGGSVSMFQYADDDSPSNIAAHYGLAISSDGGTGSEMRSLEIDVGRAALTDSDLTSDPSLLVEVYDETPTLVGSRSITDLSLVEGGVQEIVTTSPISAPQTIEIHLTNTGRVVAVWPMLGSEESNVDHTVSVAAVIPGPTATIGATHEAPAIDAPTGLSATPVAGPAADLEWVNARPDLQTRIYRRRTS
jgi:hypothetical protein